MFNIRLVILATSVMIFSNSWAEEEDILTNRYLGHGYFPDIGAVRSAVIEKDKKKISYGDITGEPSTVEFGLIANREQFDRSLSIDIETSSSWGAGGASATASLRESVSKDLKQVTFAVSLRVVRGTAAVHEIKATDLALEARNEPEDFLRVFGTDIIDEVTLGGSCVLFFTYTFETAAQARDFSDSIGITYGTTSGSAKMALSESLKKTKQNMNVTAYVAGTTELPTFFTKSIEKNDDGTKGIFTSAFSDGVLDQILTYVDEFPGKIKDAPFNALSTVGVSWVAPTDTVLSLGDTSHEALELHLDRARRVAKSLNDQELKVLDEYRNLEIMRELYGQYNTESNKKESERLTDRLDSIFEDIAARRATLEEDENVYGNYFFVDRIPQYPPTFCTTEPTKVQTKKLKGVKLGNNWEELIITPLDPNVTHIITGGASHGHSRTDPGCNNGALQVRKRTIDALAVEYNAEIAGWTRRADTTLQDHESIVGDKYTFSVCRKQPDTYFKFNGYAFTADETRDVRVLYTNWDDGGYNTTVVNLLKCGQ